LVLVVVLDAEPLFLPEDVPLLLLLLLPVKVLA
jgi:hypothetical protein